MGMGPAKGRRAAFAAVAVGLLVLAVGGLASSKVIIEKWRTWKAEKRTRETLSSMRISCAFQNRPLPEVLQFISELSGVKLAMAPEVSSAVKQGRFRVSLTGVRDQPADSLLRSALASADPELDYNVQGDTVVVGLRGR